MCRAWCVFALVAMCVRVVHCWDIAVSVKDQLIFYTNGSKTKTVNLISQNPTALVYDEVHNVMLYVDKQNKNDAICGYYLSSKDNKCYIKRNGRDIHGLAFDPVTELIFFTDTIEKSINFISLKHGHNNNIYGNLLIKIGDGTPADIGVDSCRGHIHWFHTITYDAKLWKWERAQFNGSERRLILTRSYYKKYRLTIDPQTHRIFNFEFDESDNSWPGALYSSDLDAENEVKLVRGFYRPRDLSRALTVSKDYIYWSNSSKSYEYDSVWQLPKNAGIDVVPKEIHRFYDERPLGITARYKIEDQVKGIQDCDSLSSLLPIIKVTPDCTDEQCGYDVCENYCFQGNCSINHKGLPTCSCNVGYSGKRCEVDACHGYCSNNGHCSLNENSEPVCLCKRGQTGDRCEVSHCLNFCMHGNCSLRDDGHPSCSCYAGYTGPRCEVDACHGYCLNNGDCSFNANNAPVCQCKRDYSGDRCEVSHCLNYCMYGNCGLNGDGHPTCSCDAGYSGERCEISVCHGYCLNDGDCSLNEEDQPVCQCVGSHEGTRCEADMNETTATYDSAKRNLTLAELLSSWRKPSSKIFVLVEV